ncbi:hypothetical protein D9757_008645 [Collybiopsis confluens]|uniref:Peroxidase n=1 Tax=Collybiopsis confluens TaxID=2823264 RepID=A0A8H5H4N2_9AGAR|nr:hypothetical protein D9757_008645 [Collybiopsis confluens]
MPIKLRLTNVFSLQATNPMKRFTRLSTVYALLGLAQSLSTFKWPNIVLSYADRQLYEGSFDLLASGCPSRDNSTIPAQWLRLVVHLAYYDMATHNVDDGTGGLDGSIQFELDRPQNVGEGMLASLRDFAGMETQAPFFGMADMIALGTVLAIAGCGGPIIPFSAGRIDATGSGPATAPEPQQDLATHTELFRSQGFTPTEMIALVACGHTLGGVRQVDFPQIVRDNTTVVQTFDSTPAFDTAIVSEYLQNTTQNPLVVGPNITTRSDFRIFSSDGNATMQSLLSTDNFNKTCASLFERMINTVPANVKLTDPITEPFQYLVTDPMFAIHNGSLSMTTALRVLNDNPHRTVTLFWTDRQGSFCPPSIGCSIQSDLTQDGFQLSSIGPKQGFTASRYSFNATINLPTSISKFWFEVNENDGSKNPVTIVNNGGGGFVIEQDSLFVDIGRSKTVVIVDSESHGILEEFTEIVVAIRSDPDAHSNVSVTTFIPSNGFNGGPPFIPTINTTKLQLDTTNAHEAGYVFLKANISVVTSFLDLTADQVGSGVVTAKDFDVHAAPLPFIFLTA